MLDTDLMDIPALIEAPFDALLPDRLESVSFQTEPFPGSLGQLGPLEVRLARNLEDIRQSQDLRTCVFLEERLGEGLSIKDSDIYDEYCDHLLVIDRTDNAIVGTYRLLRREQLPPGLPFYSASEYDISPLLNDNAGQRLLELGRSCVLPAYRNKRTVELLWQGIWAYVKHHRIDVMFGCASFEGTNPSRHALALNFLSQFKSSLPLKALPGLGVKMNGENITDPKKALRALPPLIKGYLRLGASFGEGAVIDHAFGTVDVLVVLPVKNIDPRYIVYFDA